MTMLLPCCSSWDHAHSIIHSHYALMFIFGPITARYIVCAHSVFALFILCSPLCDCPIERPPLDKSSSASSFLAVYIYSSLFRCRRHTFVIHIYGGPLAAAACSPFAKAGWLHQSFVCAVYICCSLLVHYICLGAVVVLLHRRRTYTTRRERDTESASRRTFCV